MTENRVELVDLPERRRVSMEPAEVLSLRFTVPGFLTKSGDAQKLGSTFALPAHAMTAEQLGHYLSAYVNQAAQKISDMFRPAVTADSDLRTAELLPAEHGRRFALDMAWQLKEELRQAQDRIAVLEGKTEGMARDLTADILQEIASIARDTKKGPNL